MVATPNGSGLCFFGLCLGYRARPVGKVTVYDYISPCGSVAIFDNVGVVLHSRINLPLVKVSKETDVRIIVSILNLGYNVVHVLETSLSPRDGVSRGDVGTDDKKLSSYPFYIYDGRENLKEIWIWEGYFLRLDNRVFKQDSYSTMTKTGIAGGPVLG